MSLIPTLALSLYSTPPKLISHFILTPQTFLHLPTTKSKWLHITGDDLSGETTPTPSRAPSARSIAFQTAVSSWNWYEDSLQTQPCEIPEDLTLGCGHGLPGIFTALKGASTIHFQDFNAEVLRFLTVPNAKANLIKNSSQCQTSGNKAEVNMLSTVRFFAGDWSEVHDLLLHGSNDGHQNEEDYCTRDVAYDGYDIILMAETIYEPSSLQHLYELIKKFIDLAEVNGQMKTLLLAEVADGSSNVREVWKLSNE
ncbi:hypothetical protein MA16_Dca021789 [Dendrobium catenatum]|uniref:protein-histidine N-methyltransferase n=1 Tax=Dendrobium catenatum TaxID=906689 RepID=A0A2I0WXV0_9ASPA|nr:hypothetical protein MA16_Dca021789 [Dendrobium catenatum]